MEKRREGGPECNARILGVKRVRRRISRTEEDAGNGEEENDDKEHEDSDDDSRDA